MHGEPERGLEHIFLPHPHPEGQDQPRDVTRELAGELHAPAFDEEIDDGEVELVAARGGQGGCARAHHLHAVTLTPEHDGQRAAASHVAVYQQNAIVTPSNHSRPEYSKARTTR